MLQGPGRWVFLHSCQQTGCLPTDYLGPTQGCHRAGEDGQQAAGLPPRTAAHLRGQLVGKLGHHLVLESTEKHPSGNDGLVVATISNSTKNESKIQTSLLTQYLPYLSIEQ